MTDLLAEQIPKLEAVGSAALHAANQALVHVPQDARSAFTKAGAELKVMHDVSGAQSLAIEAARTKSAELQRQGFGEASRIAAAEAVQLTASAEAAISKAGADAHLYVSVVEGMLKAHVLPPPAKDPGTRALQRQEVDAAIGQGGLGSVATLALLASSDDDALAGEAVSGYARRQLTRGLSPREADEAWKLTVGAAAGHRLQQPRYKKIAETLAAIKGVHGGLDAERQAALMRVRQSQPLGR
jgi:hypothetical protein